MNWKFILIAQFKKRMSSKNLRPNIYIYKFGFQLFFQIHDFRNLPDWDYSQIIRIITSSHALQHTYRIYRSLLTSGGGRILREIDVLIDELLCILIDVISMALCSLIIRISCFSMVKLFLSSETNGLTHKAKKFQNWNWWKLHVICLKRVVGT